MAPPNTYLLGSPDVKDPFGRAIMSSDLVKGLKELNPTIRAWEQHTPHLWWPGKAAGISTLWLGQSGGKSRKITAFKYGPIPEFTQTEPSGAIITKGWRAIFEKVVRCKAVSRRALELKFRVDLGLEKPDKKYCLTCRKNGSMFKAENASGLCDLHEHLRKRIAHVQAQKARRLEHLRRTG